MTFATQSGDCIALLNGVDIGCQKMATYSRLDNGRYIVNFLSNDVATIGFAGARLETTIKQSGILWVDGVYINQQRSLTDGQCTFEQQPNGGVALTCKAVLRDGRKLSATLKSSEQKQAFLGIEPCWQTGTNYDVVISGTIIESQTIDDPSDADDRVVNSKFMAIALDSPHCFPGGKTATLIEAINVSRKWLGQHVAIIGDIVINRRFYLDAHDAVTGTPGNASKCQITSLISNGILTHGSMVCNKTWLDRPASYAVAEMAKLCKSLGETVLMTFLKHGMDDFDRTVSEFGQDGACRKLDANMTFMEKSMRR